MNERLINILENIADLASEVHATEADYEYCMNRIEVYVKEGIKLIKQSERV